MKLLFPIISFLFISLIVLYIIYPPQISFWRDNPNISKYGRHLWPPAGGCIESCYGATGSNICPTAELDYTRCRANCYGIVKSTCGGLKWR